MNILETIVENKRREVELLKTRCSYQSLEKLYENKTNIFSTSLKKSILNSASGIIAEFKRKSPSKGAISQNAQIEQVIPIYNTKEIAGISILTDSSFFGGSIQDLKIARELTQLPILRKEFVIDSYQILEAAINGANAILLIAACLTPKQVLDFAHLAHQYGLEVLLEVHDRSELDYYNDYVDVLGVNNRDLKTFKTDISRSINLVDEMPQDVVKISESGIMDMTQIQQLKNAGFDGFLIGEYFMRQMNS